jgi:hypothetical protein
MSNTEGEMNNKERKDVRSHRERQFMQRLKPVGGVDPPPSRQRVELPLGIEALEPSVIKTAQKTFSAASTEPNAATVLNSHPEFREKTAAVLFCSGEELVAKNSPREFLFTKLF